MTREEGRKRPKDVARQVLRAIYKVINLQTRRGMYASGVPNLTLVRMTPAEVFEATNVLLAETVRIMAHLNITLPHSLWSDPRNKTPNDVFAQVLLLIDNLDVLVKGHRQGRVDGCRRGPVLCPAYTSEAPRAAMSMDRSNRYSQIAKLALTDS
ncbi:MAG: hypothetical protein OXC14_10135 [Rhodospirillaceae bacterium]|nr:hypothetical protein [Rhodospirillaceae bacterium]